MVNIVRQSIVVEYLVQWLMTVIGDVMRIPCIDAITVAEPIPALPIDLVDATDLTQAPNLTDAALNVQDPQEPALNWNKAIAESSRLEEIWSFVK